MARQSYLTRDQQIAQAFAGTPVPDGSGRIVKNGAVISAGDAASAAATTARNAELAAQARGQAIGSTRPAPVIPDAAMASLGSSSDLPATRYSLPATSSLGQSPVAKAVMSSLATQGQPAAAAPAIIPGDVNSYSGSRYSSDNSQLSTLNSQLSAGAGGTRSDPGINVNSYVGSRYDRNFAANNPAPALEAPEIAMAKQLLSMNNGVGGRFYDAGNLARATPQQIQIEAALLPTRQAKAAADAEGKALEQAYAGYQAGKAADAPFTPADIAAALGRYTAAGGRDPKRLEEIRQAGEGMVKGTPKQAATPQAVTLTYPDGTAVRGVWDGNNFSQEKQPAEAAPTTLGKLISERDAAVKSGRTDLVGSYDSAIAAQGKREDMSPADLVALIKAMTGQKPAEPENTRGQNTVPSPTAKGVITNDTPLASQADPSVFTPKTKAERDALAPGTRYVGPDGKTYTKK